MVTASFQLNVLTPWSLRTRTGAEPTNNDSNLSQKESRRASCNAHHRHLQESQCMRLAPLKQKKTKVETNL